jgi:hypothetical protein
VQRPTKILPAAIIAVIALSACAPPGTTAGAGGQSVVDPAAARLSIADQPAEMTQTCFWGTPTGPQDGVNLFAPETNVAYWYNILKLPAGAKVELSGRFPHSRFMSLTSYGTVVANGTEFPGVALSALSDYQIEPDRGSVNPFRDGADRDGKKRSFTITIDGQIDPGAGNRKANTLYVGQAGHTEQTQTVELLLRNYRPDVNRTMAGIDRLPAPTVVLADGTKKTGPAACAATGVITDPENVDRTKIGIEPAAYLQQLNLKRPNPADPANPLNALPTHPALRNLDWNRFINTQQTLAPFWAGTVKEPDIAKLPTAIAPGLYAAPANAYIAAYADRTFGPDPHGHNVLVLRGKMPTHPTTFNGDPANNSAGKQVRYWSICNYGTIIAKPAVGAVNTECLFDEEIPVDRNGFYTIVVSLPEDRPANARQRCGVAWMDWTRKGDGIYLGSDNAGHDRLITLMIRNQFSDPSFAQGVDKVTTPDTEKQVMGDYYPTNSYTSRNVFEHRGCMS